MTEACTQYTHLDGQLANLALHTIPTPNAATPSWGRGDYPLFQSNGLSCEVFLHAPGMPKIAGEGRVGVLLGLALTYLVHYLLVQGGYLAKHRNLFDT